jgi:hypothetical protein
MNPAYFSIAPRSMSDVLAPSAVNAVLSAADRAVRFAQPEKQACSSQRADSGSRAPDPAVAYGCVDWFLYRDSEMEASGTR